MIDQTSQFFAILTNVGAAKQANADALGIPWKITQMGVGDADGTDPIPAATQIALINERRRAPLNQLKVDPANSAIIIAEQVIPAEVGGWWIREIGLYDADNDLVAIANCAPSFKPLLTQGSGRTQVVRMNLLVSNSSTVELKIDPSVVLATRSYVDQKVLDELNKQDFKHSVLAATTGPVALNGLQIIDGVQLTGDARVLVKHQAASKDNGLYNVSAAGVWTRSADADSSLDVTPGMFVHVERGTLNGDSVWQLVTDGPIVLGVSDLLFEMVSGRTGINAGTYRSVTVDKYGRVIGGTNPTTLTGYGIDIPTQAEAEAQADQDNTKPMTALRVFQAIAKRLVQATESAFGWAKIATQTQTNSGADDTTIVTPKKFSAGIAALVIQATEVVKGIAKVATLAQVNAGSGDDVMVTPYKMRLGFTVSFNASGYVVFPSWLGSLIIQWTSSASIAPGATGAAYWPMAFPVGCIWALAAPLGNAGNGNAGNVVAGGVSPVAVNLYNWGGSINSPARVIGIGV
ncbi:phage tail protein [Pseudomonas sp. TNT2022 ID1044]|uniref:phage tail protein n=1 Tax=Pseudomonas sp. TNT2022 ID1044 TaxID=2942636 RepID=UPI00235FC6D8|nr:phage tail protein [Pseudomonas sp. TNT2022 ID1044]MDD0998840.1 phage tail protein [Pseudomonas sp. TNT2022 ID1044]